MAQIADAPEQSGEIAIPGARRGWPNPFARGWFILRRYPIIPGIVITALIVVGLFAPQLSPTNWEEQALQHREHPQTWGRSDEHNTPVVESDYDLTTREGKNALRAANKEHHNRWTYILGGDQLGRDVLSRVIGGTRTSLKVAGIALAAGTTVGVILALVAGYYGGIVDEVIMRMVDLWYGLPFLLIAILASVTIGASERTVMILLALLAWSGFVRQIRSDVLVLKTRDYVAAARVVGASDIRIIIRHIFPGTVSTMLVIASLNVGGLILAEAALSFLSVGIPDPIPTWGKSVDEGREFLETSWWISFWPGFAIFLVVMSLNFFGDWLRDRLDPRLRQIN